MLTSARIKEITRTLMHNDGRYAFDEDVHRQAVAGLLPPFSLASSHPPAPAAVPSIATHHRNHSDTLELDGAVKDVEGGMSEAHAARLHNVKRTTVCSHVHDGKDTHHDPIGPPHMMDDPAEKRLEELIDALISEGRAPRLADVRAMAAEVLKAQGISSRSSDGQPSKEWATSFLQRHEFVFDNKMGRVSQADFKSCNPQTMQSFFDRLNWLQTDPSSPGPFSPHQIWNCDETNVSVSRKDSGEVEYRVHRRGDGAKVISNAYSDSVTLMSFSNAAGETIEPCIFFGGSTIDDCQYDGIPRSVRLKATGDIIALFCIPLCLRLTFLCCVGNGYTNDQTYLQSIEHFVERVRQRPGLNNNEPILLIVDSHVSRDTYEHVRLAIDNRITLLALPSHTSRLLQAMDRGVFAPFKTCFNKITTDHSRQHPTMPITRSNLAYFIYQAVLRSHTPTNINDGFRRSGVYPYDPTVIRLPSGPFSPDASSSFQPAQTTAKMISSLAAASASSASSSTPISTIVDFPLPAPRPKGAGRVRHATARLMNAEEFDQLRPATQHQQNVKSRAPAKKKASTRKKAPAKKKGPAKKKAKAVPSDKDSQSPEPRQGGTMIERCHKNCISMIVMS